MTPGAQAHCRRAVGISNGRLPDANLSNPLTPPLVLARFPTRLARAGKVTAS